MTTASNSTVSEKKGELDRLLQQRDLALACLILAVAMTGAILWSNFGAKPIEVEQANQAVRQHRELLTTHQKIMQEVHAALLANQQAMEALR